MELRGSGQGFLWRLLLYERRAAAADLVLWVEDATGPLADRPETQNLSTLWLIRNKADLVRNSELKITESTSNEQEIQTNNLQRTVVDIGLTASSEQKLRSNRLLTKMVNSGLNPSNESLFTYNEHVFTLSAATGAGFDELLSALSHYAASYLAGAETTLITRERHRKALQGALEAAL